MEGGLLCCATRLAKAPKVPHHEHVSGQARVGAFGVGFVGSGISGALTIGIGFGGAL